jgi:hypothetical protein
MNLNMTMFDVKVDFDTLYLLSLPFLDLIGKEIKIFCSVAGCLENFKRKVPIISTYKFSKKKN